MADKPVQQKVTMIIVSLFLGAFGVHRFMMGYGNWWLMLITLGGCGIWALIDLIMIITGKMTMADGSAAHRMRRGLAARTAASWPYLGVGGWVVASVVLFERTGIDVEAAVPRQADLRRRVSGLRADRCGAGDAARRSVRGLGQQSARVRGSPRRPVPLASRRGATAAGNCPLAATPHQSATKSATLCVTCRSDSRSTASS